MRAKINDPQTHVFEQILDEVRENNDFFASSASDGFRRAAWSAVNFPDAVYVDAARVRQVYAPDAPARAEPPKKPKRSVAEELQLTPDLSVEEINRRRRSFARENHPDHCCEHERAQAEERMASANAMIDHALTEAKRRQHN